MRRTVLLLLGVVAGCAALEEGDPSQGLDPVDVPGGSTGGDDPGDPELPPESADESDCGYVLVHDEPGTALEVTADTSALEVMPLGEGEGFFCLRAAFDLTLPDNLDELSDTEEGCPTHLALASFYGSAATGEFLATSFFRAHEQREDGTCEPGLPALDVGNFLNYTERAAMDWIPGERYRVMIEARPWVTRVRITDAEGFPIGPTAEAALWNATVEDTRDPVVRLGQSKVSGGIFFPWYGARYENLQIWAAVVPAAG